MQFEKYFREIKRDGIILFKMSFIFSTERVISWKINISLGTLFNEKGEIITVVYYYFIIILFKMNELIIIRQINKLL